jgi:hypothetical protein
MDFSKHAHLFSSLKLVVDLTERNPTREPRIPPVTRRRNLLPEKSKWMRDWGMFFLEKLVSALFPMADFKAFGTV